MNTIQKLLIEVLRCFALGTEPKLNITYEEKQALFELSKRHSIVGVVAYTLKLSDKAVLDETDERFAKEYDRTIMQMLSREASAMKLCTKLTQMNIPHILFKGMTVSEVYPIAELRAFGDVDIIVEKTHIDSICDYMKSEGFEHALVDGGVVNSFKRGREKYEFHNSLNVSNIEDKEYFSDVWGNTVVRYGKTLQFNNNFHLCYLISHLEKHVYGSGAGVRMYLDVALYINKYKDDIDLEFVRNILSSCGLGGFLNTVLYLCHRWFDCEVPVWVEDMDEQLFEQLCSFIFQGGVFGKQDKAQVFTDDLRRELSSGKKGAKLRFFFSRVFPKKYELYRMFPRYEQKPLLLPVAWCCHVGNVIKNRKLANIKTIVSADSNSIEAKKDFLKKIGCER